MKRLILVLFLLALLPAWRATIRTGGTPAPAGNSPDGTVIRDGIGTLQTVYGTWSWGSSIAPGMGCEGGGHQLHYIYLNGLQVTGNNFGYASKLEADFGGNTYALGFDCTWYQYDRYFFGGNSSGTPTAPNNDAIGPQPTQWAGPYTASPDGSTLTTLGSGTLTTRDGVWSLSGGGLVQLQGIPIQQSTVSADELMVNAKGVMFFHSGGTWYAWLIYQKWAITGSPPSGPIPYMVAFTNTTPSTPYPEIAASATAGTQLGTFVVTTSDESTFSGTVAANGYDGLGVAVSGNMIVTTQTPPLTCGGGFNSNILATQNGVTMGINFDTQVCCASVPCS